MYVYVWIAALCLTVVGAAQNCKYASKCRTTRVHGMKGVDCFNRDFREFPQCMAADVEVIDLEKNRIRVLTKVDMKKFSDMKMLYLSDNAISLIEDEAFEGKNELTTLDLSMNSLSKLPLVVFHLPSLKSLYLGQNLNINIADVVERAKPITAPLYKLDISYIMTMEADELPDLGAMPLLTKYNISGNQFLSIGPKHFAGLCSLKNLENANVTAEFDKPCDCWTLNQWLTSRKVNFTPFRCEVVESECFDVVGPEELELFDFCRKEIKAIEQKSRMMKILIPIAVIVLILLIGGVYYGMRRRKQRLRNNRRDPSLCSLKSTLK